MKLKTTYVCGVEGKGTTMTEAKAKAELTARHFIQDAQIGPSMVFCRRLTAIVWPHVEGWSWRILTGDEKTGPIQPNCLQAGTRDQACVDAVYAMAQRQWTTDIEDDEAWIVESYRGVHVYDYSYQSIKDLIYSCQFTRLYQTAREAGATDHQAHMIAGRVRTADEARALASSLQQATAA